jgi:hypothetical protein
MWKKEENLRKVENIFGIDPDNVILCSLHSELRITKKLFELLFNRAANPKCGRIEALKEAITAPSKSKQKKKKEDGNTKHRKSLDVAGKHLR